MPETAPWTRVKDKITGHEYSVRHVDEERHHVLDGVPAADAGGRALPAKYAEKVTATDGYESQTNSALKAEIERRNALLDDEHQLAVSGTKSDLVAVLRADDTDHGQEA